MVAYQKGGERIQPDVIVYEFALGIASLLPALIRAKLRKRKFILFSHGYNRKYGFSPQSSFADKIRLRLMKLADALIVYTYDDKALLSNYICDKKIFVAQNTLDTDVLRSVLTELEREGRAAVRERLGYNAGKHIIFIGRLVPLKKPEILLDIMQHYQGDETIFVHYIGDGSMT